MKLWAGTSGFAYKAWRGHFYPEDAKEKQLLWHYGERLNAVEINSSFYRMPKAAVLESWAKMVPPSFRFVLKASQTITHRRRLVDCEDAVEFLWQQATVLGDRLGPFLFQLPPNFRADPDRLARFVASLPSAMRAAFEFRHDSWNDPAVHRILADRDLALCCAETDDEGGEIRPVEIVATASWGYLRLRRETYMASELQAWRRRMDGHDWGEAFCFFKHEDGPGGPQAAAALLAGER